MGFIIKRITIFIFLAFIFISIFGQKTSGLTLDINSFNENFEIAQWLCYYDNVAWITTDSVFAAPKDEFEKLGKEWFCFKAGNTWHAAYGKYEEGNYTSIFHYIIDSSGRAIRVNEIIDTSLANPYSRALINARSEANKYTDSTGITFNKYLKRNLDNTISVWIFPAFQSNNVAVYGGEYFYRFDSSGNHLLSKKEYFKGKYLGFKVDKPRDIWLDYKEVEQPTLGAIFFAWYYKEYFTGITIENKRINSKLYKTDKKYFWVHLDKGK